MWEVPENRKGGRWLITVGSLEDMSRTPVNAEAPHQQIFAPDPVVSFVCREQSVDPLHVQIEKGRPGEIMDLIWLEILIAMIGEQFGEDMDLICGLVCNVRGKGSKVSDECVVFRIVSLVVGCFR